MSYLEELAAKYSEDGGEKVGYIHKGLVIDVFNISNDPENSFMVLGEDILRWGLHPETTASWHTHPGRNANLSVADYESFLNYPLLLHYIIGKNEIRVYRVEDGTVIEQKEDLFTW